MRCPTASNINLLRKYTSRGHLRLPKLELRDPFEPNLQNPSTHNTFIISGPARLDAKCKQIAGVTPNLTFAERVSQTRVETSPN
jgi:hypothetical protein